MYKEVDALLENTKFEVRVNEEGKILSYRISPKKGYKLHEITLDEDVIDEETFVPTGKKKIGYTTAFVTASDKYDFEANAREIYAVKDKQEEEE